MLLKSTRTCIKKNIVDANEIPFLNTFALFDMNRENLKGGGGGKGFDMVRFLTPSSW